MKKTFLILALFLIAAFPRPFTREAVAQDSGETCQAVVQAAIDLTTSLCEATARDQACYGNVSIEALARGDVIDFQFSESGDMEEVGDIETLRLQTLDYFSNEWGVALMNVQASLSDNSAQTVTLLLFGNVEIDNQGGLDMQVPMTITQGANVRLRPHDDGALLGSLDRGTQVTATARHINEAGELWVRIIYDSDLGSTGWVISWTVDGNLDDLPLVSPGARNMGPMQAFTLTTGGDDRPCEQAPDSGLLIQTPEGVGEITFLINEVDIQLGSTAYVQAVPGDAMRVYTLDGNVSVRSRGITQRVVPGSMTTIRLSEAGTPASPPSLPVGYDEEALLPLVPLLNALPTPVGIPPALIIMPSDVSSGQSTADLDVDCSTFRIVSPLEGLAYEWNTFYWSPPTGEVTGYRVNIYGANNELELSYRTGSGATSLRANLSTMETNFEASWEVQALVDDQVACYAQILNMPRQPQPASGSPTLPPSPTSTPEIYDY